MKICLYSDEYLTSWEDFVANCPMASFLHTRKFLSYHGDRFKDLSLMVFNGKEKLVAIFPAAENLELPSEVVSHPGITYGGIIHQGLSGQKMLDVMHEIRQFYIKIGYTNLVYKPVPVIFHEHIMCDDLYAVFRLNGILTRRDLSCSINLKIPSLCKGKRLVKIRNMVSKAEKEGCVIERDAKYLPSFWRLLSKNLFDKYQSEPTHNLKEMQLLFSYFPENIELRVVLRNNQVIAGSVLFNGKNAMHTQYLTTDFEASNYALDYLVYSCIEEAKERSFCYFDFGISTEEKGMYLNNNLYRAKVKHGGTGILYDTYNIPLN